MGTQLFINLPVADVPRATSFYLGLGYEQNQAFSDERASCIMLGGDLTLMLLSREYFATFITRPVADPGAGVGVINCLGLESRDAVDALVDTALASGAAPLRDPEDHGFMYGRSFYDPDGHAWEVAWMDPDAALPEGDTA